jgi:hypothetical protein
MGKLKTKRQKVKVKFESDKLAKTGRKQAHLLRYGDSPEMKTLYYRTHVLSLSRRMTPGKSSRLPDTDSWFGKMRPVSIVR